MHVWNALRRFAQLSYTAIDLVLIKHLTVAFFELIPSRCCVRLRLRRAPVFDMWTRTFGLVDNTPSSFLSPSGPSRLNIVN